MNRLHVAIVAVQVPLNERANRVDTHVRWGVEASAAQLLGRAVLEDQRIRSGQIINSNTFTVEDGEIIKAAEALIASGRWTPPVDPATVVVEVGGGVVQAVYTDAAVRVVLVDWDDINDEDGEGRDAAGFYSTERLADLPDSTRTIVEHVLKTKADEPCPPPTR